MLSAWKNYSSELQTAFELRIMTKSEEWKKEQKRKRYINNGKNGKSDAF